MARCCSASIVAPWRPISRPSSSPLTVARISSSVSSMSTLARIPSAGTTRATIARTRSAGSSGSPARSLPSLHVELGAHAGGRAASSSPSSSTSNATQSAVTPGKLRLELLHRVPLGLAKGLALGLRRQIVLSCSLSHG